MSRLIVAALVRNESDRFWWSALEAWLCFADEIVVLDDNSEDETARISSPHVAVYFRNDTLAWGKEASARAELWEKACLHADVGDYVLILDADMVPARDPRPLLALEPDAIAFTLYDLWSADEYRLDGYWRGHEVPRVWLVKRPPTPAGGWLWSDRGVHCGHLPVNLELQRIVTAPSDFSLLHYAYSTPELRASKHEQYMAIADQLSDFEWAHAASILSAPTLAKLPFDPDYRLTLA